MWRWYCIVLPLCGVGCVSTPETKVASANTAAALKSLEQAQASFANLYTQEFENTVFAAADQEQAADFYR